VGLTRHARLLWNLEALLHQTFDGRGVSVSRPENFSCAGECAPLSTYRLYRFTFARAIGSSFHVSKRTFGDNGEFGNYPVPVLVRGRAVACDARETRFLISFRSTASFTLDCLPRPSPRLSAMSAGGGSPTAAATAFSADGFFLQMSAGGRVQTGSNSKDKGFHDPYAARRLLGFRRYWKFGYRFGCVGRSSGLECWNRAGHGWVVRRPRGYRTF